MKKIILYSIAISFFFCSCEDILAKTLELEDFDFEKQMALSGTLISSADQFRLLVSENQAITSPRGDWQPLDDAMVSLYKDGSLVGELAFKAEADSVLEVDSVFVLDLENIDVTPGVFSIEVSHPDFPTASAASVLPSEIPLTEIVFEEDFGIAPNFLERTDAIHITFSDPPDEENYYSFTIDSDTITMDTFIWQNDTTIFERELYLSLDTNEPNVHLNGNTILFKDDFFNGQEHTISFYVLDSSGDGISEFIDDLEISWEVTSIEHFEFTQSLDLYYDAQGFGPFSEAVTVFNNVEGGVGIFSAINRAIYKIP